MNPFSILHISDLHRSPNDAITNSELVSAIVRDRDNFSHEEPRIAPPAVVVVSGDLIQGVPLGATDFQSSIVALAATSKPQHRGSP